MQLELQDDDDTGEFEKLGDVSHLGATRRARLVADRDLDNPMARGTQDGRELEHNLETVAGEIARRQRGAPHAAQSSVKIREALTKKQIEQSRNDSVPDSSQERHRPPICCAAEKTRPVNCWRAFERVDDGGHVFGKVFQIGVNHDDSLAVRRRNAVDQRTAVSEIAHVADESHVGQLFQHFERAVGRTVIDKDELRSGAHSAQPSAKLTDRRRFVENRNDDVHGGRRWHTQSRIPWYSATYVGLAILYIFCGQTTALAVQI